LPPRVGVVVNPIAGLGGRVGLKGTDGADVVARALALGAEPNAGRRMTETVAALRARRPDVVILGADAEHGPAGSTSAADTVTAARAFTEASVDLLLFAGGDGTARDILAAVGNRVPVLGVPAGVKMHSGVFGASPRAAADLAVAFLAGDAALAELEVMDLDEEAYRSGRVSARLFGYLRGPYRRDLVQGVKVGGVAGEAAALDGLAAEVAARVGAGVLAILGPGTTTRAIAATLGVAKTLLGVDLVCDGQVIVADGAEADVLRVLAAVDDARLIVAPIGGQGHILGRGNQQISPAVIRRVGLDRLIVAATPAKLASLHDQALRVDTGDAALDRALAGYRRVVTGRGAEAVCRVVA
jgi:predicted polyphosphate/ATP-dependent NAD kinase